jgi:hypothetical protein
MKTPYCTCYGAELRYKFVVQYSMYNNTVEGIGVEGVTLSRKKL